MLTAGEIEWARWGGDDYVAVHIPLDQLPADLRNLLTAHTTECLRRDSQGVLQVIDRRTLKPRPHHAPTLPPLLPATC